MVSNELKKLSRRELVDIIYQLKKNEQLLQDEIASLQEALEDRRIHLSTAGSIAEAAISITNVLSSTQAAADLYLQEVTYMKQDAEIECAKMIDEAKQQAAEIIAESEKQRTDLNKLYQYELEKWYKLHQEVQLLENASAS
jgi:cell division septum initiation protein DivIVA